MDDHENQEKQQPLISHPFIYGDFCSTGMQSFEPGSHELMSLQAGMEMLGIPSKHHQSTDTWRGFFPPKVGSSSGFSSGENYMVPTENPTANSWHPSNRMMVDDSSLRCLFPSEGSEQPASSAQRLSLSLYNRDTSDVDHSFDQSLSLNSRDGLFSKPTNLQLDGRYFASPESPNLYQQPQNGVRSSKYLVPAQDLLNEFCSLGGIDRSSKRHSFPKPNKWEEGESSSSSSLYSMDLLELQKRKSRLLAMLEEVDKRYRRYCEQMRSVVSGFEAVAGEGAANVYSTLASKAMSRHFRCLRDGVVAQIQATKKAMGEKDPVTPGATRGETPRLKVLDQCLRQQKAFQQAGVMENHPWRPQRGLPERSVSVLRAWLFEHFLHPYPSDVDKHILARQTGLSRSQVSNWFINARVRLWKPMVEEMYMEETKEQDNTSAHTTVSHDDSSIGRPSQLHSNCNPNPNTTELRVEDQKPEPGHLVHDPDSLSSIINAGHCYDIGDTMHGKYNHHQQQQQQIQRAQNFGVMDLDFGGYGESSRQGFGGSVVSLTLGLQQHNGGGMSLSFSPTSQHSLFFSREGMDGCQPVQFSVVDGEDEPENLPYRNLMGAQLLRDLAG